MIKITVKGNFNNTEKFLKGAKHIPQKFRDIMSRYGQQGVEALRHATPKDTGHTSDSWSYEIFGWGIAWNNSNVVDGVPIAILLQFGHGTKNGGYVQGYDYINPALKPIFDAISANCWREVQNL